MSENILSTVKCKILDIIEETSIERTFKVECDIPIKEHGQFFQISIPKFGEAPISVSGFGDGYLEFTIRAVGKVTDQLFRMSAGDSIYLRGPYGRGWPVEKFKNKNLIIVAGGTGVAPVRSMIQKFSVEQDYLKSLNLVIGFRDSNSILFKDDLKHWRDTFNTIYTLDNGEADGWNSGLVTQHLNKLPLDEFGEDYDIVIVGPPVMMHFTGLEFLKLGCNPEKMYVSFERKMSCAVGKCGHCRIDEVYVCLEGPVFNYAEAKNLID